MIKCNSPYAYGKKCVIDMDAQETLGGVISCDTAEECDFRREDILTRCKYAEPASVYDAALKELFE